VINLTGTTDIIGVHLRICVHGTEQRQHILALMFFTVNVTCLAKACQIFTTTSAFNVS